MVIIGWYFYGSGVLNLKYIDDADYYWYSFRTSDPEDGFAGIISIWKGGEELPRFGWLSQYINEYSLDIFRRYLDKPFTSGIRGVAEYHNYRIAFRYTTL